MPDDLIRIDNSKAELAETLGDDFLSCDLRTVQFASPMTVMDFWKRCDKGTYFLLTATPKQPDDHPSVHITVVRDGQIQHATAALLKRPLIGVQEVILERSIKN